MLVEKIIMPTTNLPIDVLETRLLRQIINVNLQKKIKANLTVASRKTVNICLHHHVFMYYCMYWIVCTSAHIAFKN